MKRKKKITYLCLQAFSRSEFIKFAFNFLSLFITMAIQSESGPSLNCSPVSMSAVPSTLLTTASKMIACLLPLSSWYLCQFENGDHISIQNAFHIDRASN